MSRPYTQFSNGVAFILIAKRVSLKSGEISSRDYILIKNSKIQVDLVSEMDKIKVERGKRIKEAASGATITSYRWEVNPGKSNFLINPCPSAALVTYVNVRSKRESNVFSFVFVCSAGGRGTFWVVHPVEIPWPGNHSPVWSGLAW